MSPWLALSLLAMLTAAAPAPVGAQSRDFSSYVLLATQTLRANGLRVTAGNVGVNAGLLSSAIAFEAPGSQVVGDRVQLSLSASCGVLFANTLVWEEREGCGPAIPFQSPIFDDVEAACGFPRPLPAPECDPDRPVRLLGGQTLRLAPGVYGDLLVQGGVGGVDSPSSVVLTGGAYRFCRLRMWRNARLLVERPSSVYVRDSFVLGTANRSGPADGSGLSALDVQFFVSGTRVQLGRNADVRARLCAPGAYLSLGNGARIEGNLVARTIRARRSLGQLDRTLVTTTTVTTTTSTSTTSTTTTTTLPPPRCGDGVVNQPSEQCDDGNDLTGDCCSPACRTEPDGVPCADGEVCNGDEVCRGGICAAPSRAEHITCLHPSVAAFVTNFGDDTVSVLDTATGTVSGSVLGGRGPWAVAVHPNGTEMYVTERLGDSVSVVDTTSGVQTARIPVGRLPLGIALDASGARAYVANFDDDTVSVIDTGTRAVVGVVPVGKGPSGLAFAPRGTWLYVSNWVDNTLSVIDAASNVVVDRVTTQKRPLQMAVDTARGRLYVVNYATATVTVVGTVSRTVLATIRVGRNPFGIAVDSERSRAYVTNAASDTVSVIDTATCRVLTDVPVGRGPLGVGLDLAGGTAFVANTDNDSISVLNGPAGAVVATLSVGDTPIAFGPFIGPLPNDCPRPARVCDDADPSTSDTCAAFGTCDHLPLPPADAVRSGLGAIDGVLRTAPAGTLPPGTATLVARLVGNAQGQLAGGLTLGGLKKHLPRVAHQLGGVARVVRKSLRRGTVECDVGLRLLDLARGTRRQVRLALGARSAGALAVSTPADAGPRPEPPLASMVAPRGR